mgnify:CR=1 FL=1|tara:strand:+ start:71 stop:1393 length:1323 start_codon:yes stop_codon:yes gene_type:complete
MKYFFLIILLIVLSNCSFDNKSGIWTDTQRTVKKEDQFKEFKSLYTKESVFTKIIEPNNDLKILLNPIKDNFIWHEKFYQNSNNLNNFSYDETSNLILKSKRLSKFGIENSLLFSDDNIIVSDLNGNIIVYSIYLKKIVLKFNFYKKKYKKINKNLNIIFEKNIIYVSDNLGYLYALNIQNGNILWAKNFKIPFRSNLKIIKERLVLADTNNDIYFIDKQNGDKIKTIPTEESSLKNEFVSSFALNSKSLFYLNTNGSLYSMNRKGGINWFLSLNQSSELNDSSLFNSNILLLHKDKIIVSTDPYLYVFNANNGLQEVKLTIPSKIKPILSGNNLFLISKNNLLVCLDINTRKIVYSIDISQKLANFFKSKDKRKVSITSLAILNNDIFIFSETPHLIKFSSNGDLLDVIKLPSKLNTSPIFVNKSMIYTNNKNKLVVFN